MITLLLLAVALQDPVPLDDRLVIECVAREPEIVTPTGIAVDQQGRIWCIENNTHFRTKSYKGPESDRIRIFEDFGPDGRARKISTYAEGFRDSMSLALGPDGRVYFATRAEVMVFKHPDDRKTLARLETRGNYPHNGLCGFAFHPGGEVYFGLGENLGAPYSLVGADGTTLTGGGEGGNIYRINPDGTGLAKVATGFWNPFGMCFDRGGRLFAVDNDPDSRPPNRLLHIIEGGDYGYRFRNGRKGLHPFTAWNGELPGTLPMVAGTGEGASGVMEYASDNLPGDYVGLLLVTSWGDHVIEKFKLAPKGTSFTSRGEAVVRGGDDFRPVGIAVAPDGSVVMSDWVDKSYNVHGKGRIWRLRAKQPARVPVSLAGAPEGMSERVGRVKDPVAALSDPDPFVVSDAINALARTAENRRSRLWEEWQRPNPDPRVRVGLLLAFRRSGARIGRGRFEEALSDPSPEVRRAAIQWVAEDGAADCVDLLEKAASTLPVTKDLFEAYIAALDFLNEGARRKIDEKGSEAALERFFGDEAKPAMLRVLALRALRPTHPALTTEKLEALAAGKDGSLATEAVWTLAQRADAASQAALRKIAVDEQRDPDHRAIAVMGLGHSSAGSQEELRLFARSGRYSRIAARSLGERLGEATATLDHYRAAGAEGGDAGAGELVFFSPRGSQCASCHRVNGRGGDVGPELTRIGAMMNRGRLVESILDPSKEVAPMFVGWRFLKTDGQVVEGRLLSEDPNVAFVLLTPKGETVKLPAKEIKDRKASELSIMPADLHKALALDDFRDLVAFLASLK
jgi:hypothetical protein